MLKHYFVGTNPQEKAETEGDHQQVIEVAYNGDEVGHEVNWAQDVEENGRED